MKSGYLLFLILFILLHSLAKAQIIAGSHSATDIYYEFNPDMNFYANDPYNLPYHGVASDLDSLRLDFNQDGIFDFVIYTGCTEGFIALDQVKRCQINNSGSSVKTTSGLKVVTDKLELQFLSADRKITESLEL